MNHRRRLFTRLGKIAAPLCMLLFLLMGVFADPTSVRATDLSPITQAEYNAAAALGACVNGGFVGTPCPAKGILESIRITRENVQGPMLKVAIMQAIFNLMEFAANRVAYEAAVTIATGGEGEAPLFDAEEPLEAWKSLGLDVAGEALGSISEISASEIGIEFNLCSPGDLLDLALALGIKQKYQPRAPKCDILEVGKNWEAFGANIYQTYLDPEGRQEAMLSKFAETLKPGQNELTASLRINVAIDQKIHEQKLLGFLQRVDRQGGLNSVTDFITGNVTTPAEIVGEAYQYAAIQEPAFVKNQKITTMLRDAELFKSVGISAASTFTNTLLAQVFNRIYTGLFDVDLPNAIDLEAFGSAAGGDRRSAEQRFASLLATSPIRSTEYDALSEFVVCPAEGITNRGLYNCVMDVNFMAAVTRGSTGVAITVQEAIDEGLLRGDFPLISPQDEASNQDPFCYTYGYCYGNLVKLRQARVIPIGWELAALRNSESNPATLQEIIDGFHNCTEAGTVGPAVDGDTADKWCHLIDPDWILKYPQTDCRAVGTGEIRLSSLSPGRTSSCVDAPSCLAEDNDGNCVGGYGYCVQEENVWRFRGEECPAHYASCLSFENTETGGQGDFLVNTLQYSVCDQGNAGCRWYRTNKYLDDQGTADTEDDTYVWLPDGETYTVSARDDDGLYQENYGTGSAAPVARASYSYTSDSGDTYSYDTYAHEDRLYLTHAVSDCTDANVGCTQLYEFSDSLYLNMIQNPGFEDDADGDGEPDGWNIRGAVSLSLDETISATGSQSLNVGVPSSITIPIEQYIDVADENFYSFSVAMRAESSGARGLVRLILKDQNGDTIDAAGTAVAGDCSWSSTIQAYQISDTPSASEFETYECLFTAPTGTEQIRLLMGPPSSSSGGIYYDSVMFEVGETAHQFVEGYNTTATAAYYKLAPDYLGCDGGEDDPSACDDYAQACSAQEVGCNLYAPADGDPAVPAIISELDICPSSCVGYTTYKQEATDYESEDFPLYFIADNAASCSEQYVGCDSYTSLADSADGGETVDYYTDLRLCASEDIADGSEEDRTPSTFFTWEGSDNAGYQLQTWYLLESNTELTEGEFADSGVVEARPDLAPCTNTIMTAVNEVICDDNEDHMNQNVFDNTECDSKEDIFENPDCREFFDGEGYSHFRLYSETVSVSDACTPYRKDDGNQSDCEESGGWWTEAGFCRYYVLPELSTECPAEQNGCRSYTGGTGRNATTILRQTFEGGTYDDFVVVDQNLYRSAIVPFVGSPGTLAISNESVATDGHSLYIESQSFGYSGIETIFIDNGQTYDEDSASTCSGTVTDDGCEVEADNTGDGVADESCTVLDGESACGTLVDELIAGKTFVLEFWAKGSGDVAVLLEEEGGSGAVHDFVGLSTDVSTFADVEFVELDGSWQLYTLGPLDTSEEAFADFDESAVLRFYVSGSDEAYLDNIVLKQVEENVTVIKDSWVVPSVCDETPTGVESDQYYLGCEAYTDQDGSNVNLYQFTDLCSESAVGCEGFYHTSNSASAYTQVHNVRCVYSTDDDFSNEEVVTSTTDCSIDGVTYCSIAPGQAYCTFDSDTSFPQPLPADEPTTGTYFALVYGPETVVVEGDQSVYIVATDDVACPSGLMGCQEVGLPTYNQDQSLVTGFTSDYVINLPDEYDQILCENGELFCEEWSSTQDGTFYFKDPLNKTCEYKTDITINGQAYFGWFKSGTTEPCYWEDNSRFATADNGTSEFTRADGDEAYLINGEEFGIWRNGDEDDDDDDSWDYYQGWVGSCEDRYDLCTEFIDVTDSGGDLNPDGTSYFVTDDELLSEELLTDTQRCNGLVSQKEGCALFNNTTSGELSYSATVTYVTSMHADVFYGLERDALVDPVSCDVDDGGVFEISAADAASAGLSDTEVNLCQRRCRYNPDSTDSIDTPYAEFVSSAVGYLERSCFVDADCPVLKSADGDELSGVCANVSEVRALSDDSNEVIKVNRDRSCSAWLACESSRVSWNANSNKYDTICDSVSLCSQGVNRGDRTVCTEWDEREPVILDDFEYSSRDVTWGGVEYVGFAIPNQLPVEHYNQANLNPTKACYWGGEVQDNDYGHEYACSQHTDCPESSVHSTGGTSCTSDADCAGGGTCGDGGYCHFLCSDSVESDYRLVYDAGACDSSDGEDGVSCQVGFCADDEDQACSANGDCSGGECVVGYCIATADTGCANDNCTCTPSEANTNSDGTNVECAGSTAGASGVTVDTEYCDPQTYTCVSDLVEDADSCVTVSDCGSTASRSQYSCVPTDGAIQGQCFSNRCLTDVVDEDGNGVPDDIDMNQLRTVQCRSYPEIDSPYSSEVVDRWLAVATATSHGAVDAASSSKLEEGSDQIHKWSVPYDYVSGFQDAQVCAPTRADGANNDCLCSYDKVSYGGGAETRYYEFGSAVNTPPLTGICSQGEYHGFPCTNDSDCLDSSDRGQCLVASQVDSLYGWEGYCLERDSSIQIFGSSDQDDQACLSWLPVDQLAGATDLYGKYTEAGFPLEDVYYCSEVATYYDLYPTGTSFNSDGTVGTPTLACADSEYTGGACDNTDGTPGEDLDYGSCVTNAICPDDYVAILAPCDANWSGFDEGTAYCRNQLVDDYGTGNVTGSESDDCPYYCIHEDSRFIQIDSGDDEELLGESCIDVLNDCYPGSNQGSNKHGQTVYKVSALDHGTSSCTSIIQNTDGGSGDKVFKGCVTRGVDEWFEDDGTWPVNTGSDGLWATESGYFTDEDDWGHMAFGPITSFGFGKCSVTEKVCSADSDCPGNDSTNICNSSNVCSRTGGFCTTSSDCTETCNEVVRSATRGSMMPYNACVEIVQVASADWDDPNKAWTNRIWSSSTYSLNNRDDFVDTTSGTAYEFDYAPGDDPTFAGRLLFEETYTVTGSGSSEAWVMEDIDYDSFPLPVKSCNTGTENGIQDGEVAWATGVAIATDDYCSATGGAHWQYPYDELWVIPGSEDSFLPAEAPDHSWLGLSYEDTDSSNQTYHPLGSPSAVELIDAFGNSTASDQDSKTKLLGQWFAKTYDVYRYDAEYGSGSRSQGGAYRPVLSPDEVDLTSGEDPETGTSIDNEGGPNTSFPDADERGPTIISVGSCVGTQCYEGDEGQLTVNEQTTGYVEGDEEKRVDLSFYVYAQPNQLPLKNIIVDWGDAYTFDSTGPNWPTDNQSGSVATDNFYKNHRGMSSTGTEYCGSVTNIWGLTTNTCSSSYVLFSHNYTCSDTRLEQLSSNGRSCAFDSDGNLTNSPCTGGFAEGVGACVYKPRVHAKDNWGWCTGECEAGSDGTIGCYESECNLDCPSGGHSALGTCNDLRSSSVNDPWVYFDGYVIVQP